MDVDQPTAGCLNEVDIVAITSKSSSILHSKGFWSSYKARVSSSCLRSWMNEQMKVTSVYIISQKYKHMTQDIQQANIRVMTKHWLRIVSNILHNLTSDETM